MTQEHRRAAHVRGPTSKEERKGAGRKPRQTRIRAIRPERPAYDRCAALGRVLALWPHEINDHTATGRQNILAKLRRALRAERRRGIAGHWTYDLARHIELLHVYRQELALLGGADEKRAGKAPLAGASGEIA
jgi:hypothetical protein